MTYHITMLLFDDVELLDFCGPYEVFSAANHVADRQLFDLKTVSKSSPVVTARKGISVNTDERLITASHSNLLLIPGGVGARTLVDDIEAIRWIQDHAAEAQLVLSVCTGALLLAKAGLLDGLRATTHHSRMALLRELAPSAEVTETDRFVDNGKFVLAAGIAAGIDMAFHIVQRLTDAELAQATAHYMEYPSLQDK